jgi:sec-independent protein translocase protein TatB
MFDVGFSELIMVGLIALLVIGPERLPKAARIAGYWLGKTRSTIANVKAEIKQELHAEEMRQLLQQQQQSIADQVQQIAGETQDAVDQINAGIQDGDKQIQNDDKPV